jgi:glutaredoxin-like protein NrdH
MDQHLEKTNRIPSMHRQAGSVPKPCDHPEDGMTSQKVKLYSLSTCSHCKSVKSLLAKQDIAVDVVDIDRLKGDQRNQVLEKVKQVNDRVSFPTTVIGDDVIVGFKADRIKKALERK